MKNNILTLAISLTLVASILVIFPTENVKALGTTLFVGGSGPGNYSSIQAAIDDANPGDTVFVYSDSSPYYEQITVDKCHSMGVIK